MPHLFCSLKRIKAHSAYGGFLETNTALKRALHDLLSRGVRGQLKRDQVRNDKTNANIDLDDQNQFCFFYMM